MAEKLEDRRKSVDFRYCENHIPHAEAIAALKARADLTEKTIKDLTGKMDQVVQTGSGNNIMLQELCKDVKTLSKTYNDRLAAGDAVLDEFKSLAWFTRPMSWIHKWSTWIVFVMLLLVLAFISLGYERMCKIYQFLK